MGGVVTYTNFEGNFGGDAAKHLRKGVQSGQSSHSSQQSTTKIYMRSDSI